MNNTDNTVWGELKEGRYHFWGLWLRSIGSKQYAIIYGKQRLIWKSFMIEVEF